MIKQKQFLELASAEKAAEIFEKEFQAEPNGEEKVSLDQALGRILSRVAIAKVDVPYFDRSNFDGYAVKARDTFGAEETSPIFLKLNSEVLACGVKPRESLEEGSATVIATGGVIPRGANAVIMIENCLPVEEGINILKPVVPGEGVSFAGSDIGMGEIILQKGEKLSAREIGTLAAIGESDVWVWKKPRVGIISTGDEIISPGEKIDLGKVYDCNGVVISQTIKELGCQPVNFGIVPDNEELLDKTLREAMELDFVILSGGTSKGAGDLNYLAVEKIGDPGILVHGVALKPGKPLCLASLGGTPTAILPGFPTSALFTFTKFIAPFLRKMSGESSETSEYIKASLPAKINSDKGRTEFNLVNLTKGRDGYSAYSMGKGSGSITAFAKADGFIEIPRRTEILEAGSEVNVRLLSKSIRPADLIIIGSHCAGLDYLISVLSREGYSAKFMPVGSMGGVRAARRGECDLAGSHLMDEKTGVYNAHLLDDQLTLTKGYRRRQGIVFRKDTPEFSNIGEDLSGTMDKIIDDKSLRMINRNRGSGTRILLDKILKERRPEGYLSEVKSHNTVAASVAQNRADWGMAIKSAADNLNLGFFPFKDEEYDFIIPAERLSKPAVSAFLEILKRPDTKDKLAAMGLYL